MYWQLFVYWISDFAEQFRLQENNYPNRLALLRGFFFWLQVTAYDFFIDNNLGKLILYCIGTLLKFMILSFVKASNYWLAETLLVELKEKVYFFSGDRL